MLSIENLTFAYPKRRTPVLHDINLNIESGGVYGLLGRNGVGKSTLLYLIAGLLTPKSGRVDLFGVNTRLRQPSTLAQMMIVPEVFELPSVSLNQYVNDNARFYANFSEEDMRRYLDLFEMPTDIHLERLSMGQAKKVYMSFALAANTPLLLMDEPTNGLDIPGKVAFRQFVASGMTEERTIIISTHQVQDINLLLDHVVVMENSGILLNQSVDSILQRLVFAVTNDQDEVNQSLYALPSLQGTNVIRHNKEGEETQINLETLFDFVIKNPEKVSEIFNQPLKYVEQ